MDAIENGKKYLLATSCRYGQTILLIKLLAASEGKNCKINSVI